MQSLKKFYIPIFILFLIVNVLLLVFNNKLSEFNIDINAIKIGNLILFIITSASLALLIKAMLAKSTTNYLKGVYASLFGKLIVCGFSIFLYIKLVTKVNKQAIIVLLFLYLVYTFLEISAINKLTKDLKNGKRKSTI